MRAVDKGEALIGDLVLFEVLQGATSDTEARRLERFPYEFETAAMLDQRIAVRAAENHRKLRSAGVAMRSTVDLLIGTFCIENRHALLHSDRDFDAMRDHLGLITV